MASGILGVGQSALNTAQTGLITTGHNISNANTPGYSRQIVVQGSAGGQDMGFGFVGKGTQVNEVKRVYDEFVAAQVNTAQTSKSQVDAYYTQITRLNNLFADSTSGITPVLQDFFKGLQDMAADPGSAPARQTVLSNAQTLAARFQNIDGQLREMRDGVGNQIAASIGTVNDYAKQISQLNDAIEKATSAADGRPSNDLLDQRDLAIAELSKQISTTVVKQGASYNVFIGTGQPLVVGAKTYDLTPAASKTDPSRTEVGYVSNGTTIELAENSITGGTLGGLFAFRSQTLDTVQNSLGQLATGIAANFNAQHMLGQDQTGAIGGAFFNMGAPLVTASSANTGSATVTATITNANALTTSDYRLQNVGGNYVITRIADGTVLYNNAAQPPGTLTLDGVNYSFSAALNPGDEYLIRPTVNGASGFGVAINDISQIAAAAPIRTDAPLSNLGSGKISAGTVNGPAPVAANPLQQPVTITFNANGTFNVTGSGTGNPTNVAYTPGADISYNGWTVQISGTPVQGDTFTIGPNTNGTKDNRNVVLLAGQQLQNTMANGTTSYGGAFSQIVSMVGNKTHEVEVSGKAEDMLLSQAVSAQQSVSGVNLDEEAANLMRYQQAYQAAGKVMQTASEMFKVLLSLGGQ